MKGARTERLGEQLQQEIATILMRELKDPRMGFVTVTHVEVSRDLSIARVFYSCLGSLEERRQSQETLDRSAGYIHGLIKKRFRLKIIPQLQFRYDPSIEGSIAMTDKLNQLGQPPREDAS